MAREQTQKQPTSGNPVNRRNYLRLSGAIAVGAATVALGESNENDGANPENDLSIVGTTPRPTTYEVTVTEGITPSQQTGALSVLGTRGQSAEDAVGVGVRRYRFSGEISDLRLDDGAVAFVNGVALDSDATP